MFKVDHSSCLNTVDAEEIITKVASTKRLIDYGGVESLTKIFIAHAVDADTKFYNDTARLIAKMV